MLTVRAAVGDTRKFPSVQPATLATSAQPKNSLVTH